MIRNVESLGILLRSTGNLQEAESKLRAAVGMQEELVKRQPDVSEFRRSLATTYHNLARLLRDLGGSKGEEYFRLSLSQFERLAAEDPMVLLHRRGLAVCSTDLAELISVGGDFQEAKNMFGRALETLNALVEEFPASPEFRRSKAETHSALGEFLREKVTDTVGAEEEYRKGLELRKRLASDFPDNPGYRFSLARGHSGLGYILKVQSQLEAARKEFLEAIRIYAEFGRGVLDQGDAIEHALCLRSLGETEFEAGNYFESLKWLDQAIQLVLPIYERQPGMTKMRLLLMEAFSARAKTKNKLNQNAQVDWDEAIRLAPEDGGLQARFTRVDLLLSAGRAEAALPELESLASLESEPRSDWNQVDWYNLACDFSAISHMMPERRIEFEDRAMTLLVKAVNAGFMDLPFIVHDRTLDPIRDRAEFAQLLEKLKSGNP